MTGSLLLEWARGPGFSLAMAIFAFGVALKLLEIVALGRKRDLSEPRAGSLGPAVRTVFTRFLPVPGFLAARPLLHIGGYLFHFSFFAVLLLFRPHIELFRPLLGAVWPGLPSPLIDSLALAGMAGLLMVLITRLAHPVARFLSTPDDYISWGLTALVFVTGYAAVHRFWLPYDLLLALHVLSIDLLLAAFPFTKLMHAFTWVLSRGYAGAIAGRKGVRI